MANTKVQSEQIEDGSITADKIADGAIVATEIADNAVTTAKINADAVTGAKIADDAIDSEHYTDGSIDTAHIADAQITVAKMAANSVDSDQYVDGSIDTVHIGDAQVTTAKITDGNISTGKIADNAVTSAKIDTNIDIAGTFDVTGATTLDAGLTVDTTTLVVDATNNRVGIGTASPDAPLHITSNTPIIVFDESDASQVWRLGSFGGAFALYDDTDSAFRLAVNGDGKIGIGTTSPASALHISGGDNTAAKLTFTNTANTNTYSIHAQNNAQTLNFQEDGTTVMSLATGGQVTATAGAASAPTYSFIGDTDTGISRPTTNAINFVTNGAEKMRIHSSGHISINGTANASADGLSNLTVGGGSGSSGISIYSGTSSVSRLMFADGTSGGAQYDGFIDYNHSSQALGIGTGATGGSDITINSSGQLLLGTTSNNSDSYKMIVDANGGAKGIDVRGISYNADNGAFRSVPSGNTTYLFAAMLNSSNSTVGSIVVTSSNTTYNTTSDYRLKENVTTLENGLDRLNQLKPVKFNWIESGQEEEGFIAHEVEEAFPYAVTGEKDAVKDDGTVSPQHMDYGRITPLLVKAIQEQQEQIEQLKTEIEALKS